MNLDNEKEIRESFAMYDKDGSGELDESEFDDLMSDIVTLDQNGDSYLSLVEKIMEGTDVAELVLSSLLQS